MEKEEKRRKKKGVMKGQYSLFLKAEFLRAAQGQWAVQVAMGLYHVGESPPSYQSRKFEEE